MTRRQSALNTEMIDLGEFSLSDLRTMRSRDLADAVRSVLLQVERPRANLGSSGPPGRAD